MIILRRQFIEIWISLTLIRRNFDKESYIAKFIKEARLTKKKEKKKGTTLSLQIE